MRKINKDINMSLYTQWADICNKYVEEFTKKHEYDMTDAFWIGDDPGTILNIGDMFISMTDIRYDIDNDIRVDKFEEWYWKSLDRHEAGIKFMNYESFCKGCPDPVSPEKEKELKECRQRLAEIKKQFEKEMDKYIAKKGNLSTNNERGMLF